MLMREPRPSGTVTVYDPLRFDEAVEVYRMVRPLCRFGECKRVGGRENKKYARCADLLVARDSGRLRLARDESSRQSANGQEVYR